MSVLRLWAALLALSALAGCATVANVPINIPTADAQAGITDDRSADAIEGEVVIGLAFSGGGTRAAAYSFGVLQGMADARATLSGSRRNLVDHVDFITGVSGGSITAAYYGLRGRAALDDFRERFLIKDAEEALRTDFSLGNLSRAFSGGVNEDTRFRAWLDANLFEGATFATLLARSRPQVWINATDIYNRTPFVFGKASFSVICSDLAAYPIAGAVAASAAVPLAFAPVVLETFPTGCNAQLPKWITRAIAATDASPMLRAYAQGVDRYKDGSIKYIKLLDGGLADNFGLSGFVVAREASQTAYGPLTTTQAVKIRRVLFLVADAGRGLQDASWTRTLEGPSGAELVMAVTDTALDVGVRASYTAFERTMLDWRDALVRWRCSAEGQRARAAARGAPDCRDLKFFVGRLGFDQLSPGRTAQLNAIPTRFRLPEESVDMLIAAGRDSLATNKTFRAFLGGL